ncbi:MAG: hypothetical protein HYR85_20020 [Planctomycetes bacterium]|nr:hypothetical protein [Planctomycetota bacterium]MBI3844517.1 hypothetical protein [Planctomycetota bacterium]
MLRRDESIFPTIEVSGVRFRAADAKWQRTGLVGFVAFVLNRDLRIEATVRRTNSGVLRLSYPAHRDQFGLQHFAVHPVHDRARVEIERQVLAHVRATETLR